MAEVDNVQGGEGTPTPTPSPAPGADGAPQQGATVPASPASAQGAPEDRSNWLPPHRAAEIRSTTERRLNEQFTQREATYRSQVEQLQRQIQALVGTQPPQNPEVDAVKQQFASLFPGVASLEERAEALQALIEKAEAIEQQNEHYWTSYGRSTMDKVFSKVAEATGVPLNDAGKAYLHQNFIGYVQSSPDNIARYETDPTIVDDFVKGFTSNFIDPVRRAGAAQTQQRAGTVAGLPQDRPSGVVPTTSVPKPKDLDERVAQGWALYKTKTGGGGQ